MYYIYPTIKALLAMIRKVGRIGKVTKTFDDSFRMTASFEHLLSRRSQRYAIWARTIQKSLTLAAEVEVAA
jgi:hypothetical protein